MNIEAGQIFKSTSGAIWEIISIQNGYVSTQMIGTSDEKIYKITVEYFKIGILPFWTKILSEPILKKEELKEDEDFFI